MSVGHSPVRQHPCDPGGPNPDLCVSVTASDLWLQPVMGEVNGCPRAYH